MAKKRIIPKLQLMPSKLLKGTMSLVTTVGFDRAIEIGNPVSQAKIYEAQAADELIFVDLSHSKLGHQNDLMIEVLREVSKEVFLPLTIGGGVRSLDDFRTLLNNGADKVAINTSALRNPKLIAEASNKYGSQCVVVSIDYKLDSRGNPKVFADSGSVIFDQDPLEWALEAQELGAGEILLTSIDHDGKRQGLELEISKSICEKLSIPVIISGGCGRANDFIEGFSMASADAVSAGSFFCFQDQNPMQTRGHIANAGIKIRVHT